LDGALIDVAPAEANADHMLPSRDVSVLAAIDLQERLLGVFSEEVSPALVKQAALLIDAARILDIPVLATEQYPKGLGVTVEAIRSRLPVSVAPIEKITFSGARSEAFRSALAATGRRHVLLCGAETHVCVLQTALDLLDAGYHVSVAADAVGSRRRLDWERGLALLERAGATVGTSEMFVFHWLERAGTAEFKAVAPLVKG
jgi:nicotinamidase-related amidase